jgi:hypothetical protein
MSDVADALLAWGLFNVLVALILLLPTLLDDRLKQRRWRGSRRHIARFRVPEPRVRPWEPFAEALEERRAALSTRDIPPRD